MPSFTDGMAEVEDAIRRNRRPLSTLPSCANLGRRRWLAAVLEAEVRHATGDFWRCVHQQGAGLLFDSYHRDREAHPFRFAHEVCAREALAWLSDLNMHEGDKVGPWSRWRHLTEQQQAAWRVHWLFLARGFLRRLGNYRAIRAALRPARKAA
jgi:hypothetical protein